MSTDRVISYSCNYKYIYDLDKPTINVIMDMLYSISIYLLCIYQQCIIYSTAEIVQPLCRQLYKRRENIDAFTLQSNRKHADD